MSSWYEVVEGESLEQGDILRRCDVPIVSSVDDDEVEYDLVAMDVVVMTQSCDLANDKVDHVLLARAAAWADVVAEERQRGNGAAASSTFRQSLVRGDAVNLSLLHERPEAPEFPWSVVDFRRLVSIPKSLAVLWAAQQGPRLRLVPPYRENLAQAFARYFMRVGLPHAAHGFLEAFAKGK